METTFKIVNRDPIALRSFLKHTGREAFKRRIQGPLSHYPKFSQLYLEIDFGNCWLMMRGEYGENPLFRLELSEIPLFGWEVSAKISKRRKIK